MRAVDESGICIHLRQDLRQNERPVLCSKQVLGILTMVPHDVYRSKFSCTTMHRTPKIVPGPRNEQNEQK